MFIWKFGSLGSFCKNNSKIIEELLECIGADFNLINETETGFLSNEYKPQFEGNIKKRLIIY